MKKIFLLLAIVSFAYTSLQAQDGGAAFSLQYSVGFPMGKLQDFIGQTSWRGFSFDYRKNVKDDEIYVGFESGWNIFYEKKGYVSYTKETITLTGTQYRYLSAVPILLNVGYNFTHGENIDPYAALGIGTLWNRTTLDVGIYRFDDEDWHFTLKPELGVMIRASEFMKIIVAGKYYSAFETSKGEAINYMTLNVGFASVW